MSWNPIWINIRLLKRTSPPFRTLSSHFKSHIRNMFQNCNRPIDFQLSNSMNIDYNSFSNDIGASNSRQQPLVQIRTSDEEWNSHQFDPEWKDLAAVLSKRPAFQHIANQLAVGSAQLKSLEPQYESDLKQLLPELQDMDIDSMTPSDEFEAFLFCNGIWLSEQVRQKQDLLVTLKGLFDKYKVEKNKIEVLREEYRLAVRSCIVPFSIGSESAFEHLISAKTKAVDATFNVMIEKLSNYLAAMIRAEVEPTGPNLADLPFIDEDKASVPLQKWFVAHLANPYPTEQDKIQLMAQTGLNLKQINTWFGNHRGRYKRRILDHLAQKKRSEVTYSSASGLSSPSTSNSSSDDLAEDCGAPNNSQSMPPSPPMTRQRAAKRRFVQIKSEPADSKDPDYEPEKKRAKKIL